jgi:thiol-disulfide isomerase/thioredoxin
MADRRRPNIVLLVVIAIAVLALAAVLIGGGGGDDSDATTSSASQSPSSTASGSTEAGAVRVSGTALPPFEDAKGDPALGMQAPVVTGTDFAGDAVSIGTGPTLLVFVAHWCPHCQREVPRLVDWFGDSIPGGASLQGVATDIDPRRPNYPPSTWLTREKWTFPTLVDDGSSRAAQAFGLTAFPYFVALDANGKVVARQSGELDRAGVEKLFDEVSSS